MDEATPHIHIDFIPYTTGSTRGLDTRVSLKKALSELGFEGGSKAFFDSDEGKAEFEKWKTEQETAKSSSEKKEKSEDKSPR